MEDRVAGKRTTRRIYGYISRCSARRDCPFGEQFQRTYGQFPDQCLPPSRPREGIGRHGAWLILQLARARGRAPRVHFGVWRFDDSGIGASRSERPDVYFQPIASEGASFLP